jgi:uncharacterized membrane protein YdjX (TVP38/TMEM64 family)
VKFIAGLRKNRAAAVYGFALGVMPLAFSSILIAWAIRNSGSIRDYGLLEWLLAFAASSLTMAFALTPTTVVALASGFFLGWTALLPLVLAYVVASILGYAAARVVDRGRLVDTISDITNSQDLIDRMREGGWLLVISSRLSPVLPFAVMNLVLSALRIPLRVFVLAGLAGMLPRTILSVWVGMQFGSIASAFHEAETLPIAQMTVVALTIASILGIVVFLRRLAGRAGSGEPETGERRSGTDFV